MKGEGRAAPRSTPDGDPVGCVAFWLGSENEGCVGLLVVAGGSGAHIQNYPARVTLLQTHTHEIHRDLSVNTEAGCTLKHELVNPWTHQGYVWFPPGYAGPPEARERNFPQRLLGAQAKSLKPFGMLRLEM